MLVTYIRTFTKKPADSYGCWGVYQMSHEGQKFSATGVLPEDISAGIRLNISGQWIQHPKFGRQYRFQQAALVYPMDKDSIIAFLMQAPRIASRLANRLFTMYGTDAIEKFLENPKELSDAVSILPSRAALEAAEYLKPLVVEAKTKLPLTTLLSKISAPKNIPELMKEDGIVDPLAEIKKNPFVLLRYSDVGFIRCNTLRRILGLPQDMEERYEAAIVHSFEHFSDSSWFKKNDICYKIIEFLGINRKKAEEIVNSMIKNKKLMEEIG